MVATLASTLRSFRTTIIAGALWVTALFVALHPYADDAGSGLNGIGESLTAIASAAPDVIPAVGLVLGAYVLGVVSEAFFGSAVRVVSRLALRMQRSRATPFDTDQIGTMSAFLESAQGRSHAQFEGSREKVRSARLQLKASAPAIDREIATLQEEAAFRLQMLPPLVGLAVAVGIHAPWAWRGALVLLTLAALIAMGASANHCAERANDALADWQEAGRPALPAAGDSNP